MQITKSLHMKLRKIDILMPSDSQYGVLMHFTRKLYEAFNRTEISCRLLEGNDGIMQLVRSPPDLTLAINGAIIMEDDTLLCDHLKIPHLACLMDPSFRFMNFISSPYMIMACDDRYSCQYLQSHGFYPTFFMPHAVEKELAPDPSLERIYDIAMLATFIDYEKRYKAWKKFPQKIRHAMEEAISSAMGIEAVSFIAALEKSFVSIDCDPAILQMAYEEVELYIKGKDRLDLLKVFSDHQVHLFGNSKDVGSWKSSFKGRANFIIHPALSYLDSLQVMKQSKIVLNSCLKNKYGAHERIFSAAACGAVVITNDNDFMRENFEDEKDLILYQRHHLASLNEVCGQLLGDEKKRQRIAKSGRKKVMASHTWDHRINQMLSDLQKITLPCTNL